MSIPKELTDKLIAAAEVAKKIPLLTDGKFLMNVNGEILSVTVVAGQVTEVHETKENEDELNG
jgi:hypothetical protein